MHVTSQHAIPTILSGDRSLERVNSHYLTGITITGGNYSETANIEWSTLRKDLLF